MADSIDAEERHEQTEIDVTMDKKIGCVIAYRKNHTNYGTSLVGYALLKKIQQLGYDVEVINYVKRLSFADKVRYAVNAIRCGEWKRLCELSDFRRGTDNPSYKEGQETRIKAVEKYKAEKLYGLFRNYTGLHALQEGSGNYNTIVVGSDQVWTPLSLPNKFFNLLFANDSVRKVAYASSFGVSEIPAFQHKATGAYLDRFYRIGVREQRGKEIVESLSHQKAAVVADPTLLLNGKEWLEEVRNSRVEETGPYIFCYFLGTNREARKAANELKARTGYKIVTIRHMDEYVPEDENFGDEAPYDVNPNDFVKYISNAAYVCTDSFHCSAFSIQFHRRFMTFYRFAVGSRTGRNSRIDSLFSTLGIGREHIFNGDITQIDSPINWNAVDEKLESLRKYSIGFLQSALG